MKSEITVIGKQVRIVRRFTAPRELVFSYWKYPAKMEKWAVCKEATDCKVEMDFRVGGFFTQKMHIFGAGEFSLSGKYEEIVEPARIAYQMELAGIPIRVLVEFHEQGNQTRVVMTHDGFSDAFLRNTVSQGTAEGLDKLDALLSQVSGAGHAVSA